MERVSPSPTNAHPDLHGSTFESQVRSGLDILLRDGRQADVASVPMGDQLRRYHRQVERWLGKVPYSYSQKACRSIRSMCLYLAISDPERTAAEADERDGEAGEAKQSAITLDADQALLRYPHLVLEADPGSGKSVALRWYAIRAEVTSAPIFIRLAAYARALEQREAVSLADYIRLEEKRLVLTAEIDGESVWLSKLRFGHGVVLLDGLDEVSSQPSSTGAPEASGSLCAVR